MITIYTDGSHFKKQGRLGIGGILVKDGKKMDQFSLEITKDWLIRNYNTQDCSNPTMELLAVLVAIRKFSNSIKGQEVTIKADYTGVSNWLTGKWKTSLPYISAIKQEIEEEVSRLGIRARYVWIKGHQSVLSDDAYWNNETDKLAKGG